MTFGAGSVLAHPFSDEDLHAALIAVVGKEKVKRVVDDRLERDRKFYEKVVKEGFGIRDKQPKHL